MTKHRTVATALYDGEIAFAQYGKGTTSQIGLEIKAHFVSDIFALRRLTLENSSPVKIDPEIECV